MSSEWHIACLISRDPCKCRRIPWLRAYDICTRRPFRRPSSVVGIFFPPSQRFRVAFYRSLGSAAVLSSFRDVISQILACFLACLPFVNRRFFLTFIFNFRAIFVLSSRFPLSVFVSFSAIYPFIHPFHSLRRDDDVVPFLLCWSIVIVASEPEPKLIDEGTCLELIKACHYLLAALLSLAASQHSSTHPRTTRDSFVPSFLSLFFPFFLSSFIYFSLASLFLSFFFPLSFRSLVFRSQFAPLRKYWDLRSLLLGQSMAPFESRKSKSVLRPPYERVELDVKINVGYRIDRIELCKSFSRSHFLRLTPTTTIRVKRPLPPRFLASFLVVCFDLLVHSTSTAWMLRVCARRSSS